MAAPKNKKKETRGRPSKYSAIYAPMVAEMLARSGMIDKQMAEYMSVSEWTINNWKNKHPEFAEAIKRGKDEPDDKVEASLLRSALGYTEDEVTAEKDENGNIVKQHLTRRYFAPNVTAQIFWLKNRRPERWRDRREIDHVVDDPLEKFAKAVDRYFGNDR